MDERGSGPLSLTSGQPQWQDSPSTLTWFAGDWLNGQSQLRVGGDRQRLVAWGEGWDHDIRHVDLLRAKKLCVSPWGPKQLPSYGRAWTEGGPRDERNRAWGRDNLQRIHVTLHHLPGPLSTCPQVTDEEEDILGPSLETGEDRGGG